MVSLVCDNCSTPLPLGSRYCNACGTPVPGEGVEAMSPSGANDLRETLRQATVDEYEIHHELGRGGMGSVYLAREIGLDRLVAIKVLPPTLMFDSGLVERFKREARMVAKLHHPNIIPVYRVHAANDLVFYTMHYVPGRTLGDIMTPERLMSIPEAEKILLDAAAGLGYAHKRGVIHRDVKPANVLIDGESRVHLTDFGIAKALAGGTHLTETGAVIGTPQYMAPEQCEGRQVDGRADQYSLAVVGYQLLAGHTPFESDSMKELLYHHLFTPPTPLTEVRPEAPQPLRDALHKALSKDPADRFDSLEDFRAAIEGKGPPIFVSWLDEPAQLAQVGQATATPQRRWGDGDTTQPLRDRRRKGREPTRDRFDSSVLAGSMTTHHRQAMSALVLTAMTIAVVGVLALANGARNMSSPPGSGSEEGSPTASVDASNGGEVTDARPANDVVAAAGLRPGSLSGVATPRFGRLLIDGDLPAGAALTIDGERLDRWRDVEVELPPGTIDIAISAAGHKPLERRIAIEAGELTTLRASLEPEPQPRPVAATDRRPLVPQALLDELRQFIVEGNALKDAGRYFEALEAYERVRDRVSAVADSYRNGGVLRELWMTADSSISAARRACELEKDLGTQLSCP